MGGLINTCIHSHEKYLKNDKSVYLHTYRIKMLFITKLDKLIYISDFTHLRQVYLPILSLKWNPYTPPQQFNLLKVKFI